MNPLLEINPSDCIFVVGPQIAACDATEDGNGPPSSYRAAIEAGILSAQDVMSFASEEENQHHHQSLREAYELDPTIAAHKVVEILEQHECYKEWLQKTFASELCRKASPEHADATVKHLLEMQKHGALLACTQYDTFLDAVAGTNPFLLEDPATFPKWASGEVQGFLHLHGVYSQPHTVRLDGTTYKKSLAESHPASFSALVELFKLRLVIFIGYDTEDFDPLVPYLLQTVYPDDSAVRNPPILVTSSPSKSISGFLQLRISQEEVHHLWDVISIGSEKNFSIGKTLEKSPDKLKVQAFLLFDDKQSFRRLGDIIYQQSKSGEIYVRRDALTIMFGEKILYGNLVTYGGNGLKQLWDLVFTEDSPLHKKGLVALGMQNAAIVWTKRKPRGLGDVTGINSVHTYATSKSIPSSSYTTANNAGLGLAGFLSTSSNPYSTISSSNGSLSSPMKSHTPLHLYPAATVALTRPTHIVSPPVLVGGSRLISPTTALLASAAVKPADGGIAPHQVQMIIQPLIQGQDLGHASSKQTKAVEAGFPFESASIGSGRYQYGIARPPERLGSSSSGPGRYRYGIAAAPELLSSIPTHLYDLHDKAGVEHTIVYIDQLTAVPHVWRHEATSKENGESIVSSDQESGNSQNTSLNEDSSLEETRRGNRKKGISTSSQAPKRKKMERKGVSLPQSPVGSRERPSAFQRVSAKCNKYSGSKVVAESSNGTPVVEAKATPITVMTQTAPPTAVSVLPGGQSVVLNPQHLIPPRATTMPLIYSPAAQPVGYCMLVNAQQPMIVANQSVPTYPLQTPSQMFYMIPGGSQTPTLVQQATPVQHHSANNRLPECTSDVKWKRSSPPQSSAPHAKRRKRSVSLPDIMQPSLALQEQKVSKDDSRVHVIEGRNPSKVIMNSHLPLPSLKSSFSDTERSRTHNRNESDTETASSESDDVRTVTSQLGAPCTASGSLPFVQFKSHIHLWEFLLELLLSPNHGSVIQWTGNGYEFRIVDPAAVAQLWGARKSKPQMTYEKLSRALRYYYTRGIMDRVPGRRLTFKFSFDIQKYITGTNRIKVSAVTVA